MLGLIGINVRGFFLVVIVAQLIIFLPLDIASELVNDLVDVDMIRVASDFALSCMFALAFLFPHNIANTFVVDGFSVGMIRVSSYIFALSRVIALASF